MSLENLLGASLEKITPARQTVLRLLDSASRHIADAKVREISAETRFASAYTAIRMLADVGLHARGFRTLQQAGSPSNGDPKPWADIWHRQRGACEAR